MGDREYNFGYVCLLEMVSCVAYGRDWVYLGWVDYELVWSLMDIVM
jgi:hypothetical protein